MIYETVINLPFIWFVFNEEGSIIYIIFTFICCPLLYYFPIILNDSFLLILLVASCLMCCAPALASVINAYLSFIICEVKQLSEICLKKCCKHELKYDQLMINAEAKLQSFPSVIRPERYFLLKGK